MHTTMGMTELSRAQDDVSVLVVDDDVSARAALTLAVRTLGYPCRGAIDGEDAWRMHRERPADVVLCDWEMPRTNGLELCRRLRSHGGSALPYFVFTSALADREHVLAGIGAGADAYLAKPIDLDLLAARLGTAERLVRENKRLHEENRRLRRDSQRLYVASRVDALTGLGNRRRLDDDLAAFGARANRYGQVVSAGLCDVDRFKIYNDHFGHLAGDEVLRRIARAIAGELRAGDAAYRFGGEEFLVILAGQALSSATVAMERLRRAVELLAIPMHPSGVVTISIGVAERHAGEAAATQPESALVDRAWLERADQSLYAAKGRGRNRVVAV